MPYGIANTTGQPDLATAHRIIADSYQGGVRFFDTAQAYGSSERVLGHCFRDLQITSTVRVISKVAPQRPPGELESSVRQSIDALGVPRLWSLLLHAESQLDEWSGPMGQALHSLKQQGLTERLGVSIYSPSRALQALDLPEVDVIQVPANVFDRRLQRVGFFLAAARAGKTVFVRSVYLQGLALLEEGKAPLFARTAVSAYRQFCRKESQVSGRFAMAYVRQMAPDALLVMGAERPEQAIENCQEMQMPLPPVALCAAWDRCWPEDEPLLINPSLWPKHSQ
jgi:aryl-alcohol dehydrogenase-like predicted oxidoreductase